MGTKREPLESQPMTIDEVGERYDGKWVLLRITGFDDHHEPAAGQVVAVSKTDAPVWRRLEKMQEQHGGKLGASYYIFCAYPPLPAGTTWGDVLEAAARRGPPRGIQWCAMASSPPAPTVRLASRQTAN